MKSVLFNKYIFYTLIASLALIRLFISWQIPVNDVYNIDERISIHSGMLLLVNSTPICLEWPGGPLLIGVAVCSFVELFFTTQFLPYLVTANVLAASSELNSFIATSINDADTYKILRLLIQIGLLMLIPFFLNLKRIGSMPGKKLFLTGILSSPALLTGGMIIHPDSLSILFWTFLIVLIIYDEQKNGTVFVVIIGILSGILISLKLTFAIVFPIIGVYLFFFWKRELSFLFAVRKTIFLSLICFLSFALFCPFIFTDTFTILKAFAGQLVTKTGEGENSLFELLVYYAPELIVWPVLALSLVGLISGLRSKITYENILLIILFLTFCIPFYKTNATYLRYSFPLIPILLFWAAAGWRALKPAWERQSQMARSFLLVIAISVTGANLFYSLKNWKTEHFTCSNISDLKNYIKLNIPSHSSIGMPEDLMFVLNENSSSIANMMQLNNDPIRLMNKIHINTDSTDQTKTPYGYFIAKSIFADHASYLNTLLSIQLEYLNTNKKTHELYKVFYYSDQAYASTISTSMNKLLSGSEIIYLISDKKMNFNEVKKFDSKCDQPYFLYKVKS